MSIALAIIGGAAFLALVAFIAFRAGARQVASTITGSPTPATARIEVETAASLKQNADEADAKANEVTHASKDDLLRIGRDELWPVRGKDE